MHKNVSYKPNSFLSQYIDRIYVFEKSSLDYFKLPPVLPGTGLELLFYENEHLSVNNKKLPNAHTVCPRKMFVFDKVQEVSFISVRFKSGAFRHFTKIPFSELNDNYCSVEALWGDKGVGFLTKLKSIVAIDAKISEIEFFLGDMFKVFHDEHNDKWDAIINELYYNYKDNTIEKIAQYANLSIRQFERGFKSQFGITAKGFQKITRFQEVIKIMLLNKKSDYLDVILDNGYYDQSHFIKEFKSLTHKKPLEFFTEENFRSHFYHKSINKYIKKRDLSKKLFN